MAKTKRNIQAPPRSGTAYRIYDDMLAVAGTLLRSRKELGAEKLQAFAESARSFAGSVADMPNLKSHVTAASQTIDDLAEYVAHTDIENIIHDDAPSCSTTCGCI
jgi:trans-2-enoyl-CoA reductase